MVDDEPYFTLAPDWVCEVFSPRTAKYDRTDKLSIYTREQVRWTWLVDPLQRTLEALRLDAGKWTLLGTWRDEASKGGMTVIRGAVCELCLQLSLRCEAAETLEFSLLNAIPVGRPSSLAA